MKKKQVFSLEYYICTMPDKFNSFANYAGRRVNNFKTDMTPNKADYYI